MPKNKITAKELRRREADLTAVLDTKNLIDLLGMIETMIIILPLLEAFDYLYENNLTIDKLWTVDKLRDPAKGTGYLKRETHITTKPQPTAEIDLPPKLE